MAGDDAARIDRRHFGGIVAGLVAGGGHLALPGRAPAVVVREGARPGIPNGVQSGDVSGRSAVVWSRTDRPARMWVEWSTTEGFRDARRVRGPAALPEDDFTARVVLGGLPPGQRVFYRVSFQDLNAPKVRGEPAVGSFRTPPADRSAVKLAWSGDTAGQGWGIDRDRGGMATYEAMRKAEPHVFVHSGDHIYADNPILPEVTLEDGSAWRNVTTEETLGVAQSLAEYRGRFRYNLLDEHVRRFHAEVPMLAQWDDHETTNNWYPGEILDDPKYDRVRSVDQLAAWGKRAFFEYLPVRRQPGDAERIDRVIHYGPLMDVIVLDQRSFRGPNGPNRQDRPGPDAALLGPGQFARTKRRLKASRAVWKVIASDMPLGIVVGDGPDRYEAIANGERGGPLGRELEVASLLKFVKDEGIRNVVWLTADVHYAAAHRFDPSLAQFSDFDPFWEFVAGPLHAGTFGPGVLDPTFGPKEVFRSIPPGMKGNRPPSENLQFFGTVEIGGPEAAMTVGLHDRTGKTLYTVELPAERTA
jgi:alkaline phosphatase D